MRYLRFEYSMSLSIYLVQIIYVFPDPDYESSSDSGPEGSGLHHRGPVNRYADNVGLYLCIVTLGTQPYD